MLAERGDLDEAQAHVNEARRLIAAYGAEDRLGLVLLTRAMTHLGLRDASEERLRAVDRELRADLARPLPPGLRADTLVDLSMVAQALGDPESRHYLREAAVIASEAEDHYLSMTVHNNLAEQELRAGDTPAAALHQREAMRLSAELGVELVTAFGFILAARIAQPEGLDAMAVRLHSAADVMLEECGFELIHDDAAQSEAVLKAARQNLGETYDEHVAAGRALTLAEALEDAEAVFDRAMYSEDAASP